MLEYKIAHQLGMTHNQLVRSISEEEFIYWVAYFEMSPTLDQRLNLHFARLMAQIVNTLRGKKKPVPPKKFLFDFAKEAMKPRATKKQRSASMMSRLRDHAIAQGAKLITRGDS